MKPILLPLLTLIVVGILHFTNQRKISDLRESLKSNAEQPEQSEKKAQIENNLKSFNTPGEKLDLSQVSRYLDKVAQGEIKANGNNAWLWTKQQIKLMSSRELITTLNSIENEELPASFSSKIKALLKSNLARLEPEKYLEKFGIEKGVSRNLSQRAFQRWIKKNPEDAIKWFDRNSEAQNLKSEGYRNSSSTRVQYEKMIATELFPNDLEALEARLKDLYEDQVLSIISPLSSNLRSENANAYLELARKSLPENQSSNHIASALAQSFRGKNLTQFGEFMDKYPLTKPEQIKLLTQYSLWFSAARKNKPAEMNTLIPFLRERGEEAVGEIYASVLADHYCKKLKNDKDLGEIYKSVQSIGTRENLEDLMPLFIKKTTSPVCECCCLKSRLERVADHELKTKISAIYRQNINSAKK